MNEYIRVWTNAFNFSERARRKEYWMFILVNSIFSLVIGFLPVANVIYAVCVTIPSFAVACRRLHDVNRSGWWLIAPFFTIPLFFTGDSAITIFASITALLLSIVLIVFLCLSGTSGSNRFGADPKRRSNITNKQTLV